MHSVIDQLIFFQTFFTRKNLHQDSRSVHLTLAFAGLSLMAAICIGVAVIRRRNARLPQNQVTSYWQN